MPLLLIAGIAFAIGAVLFALQNNSAVSVSFLFWRFDSTLALVLILTLGLGALIAVLVSAPAMIRGRWGNARLRRQIDNLELAKAQLEERLARLEAAAPPLSAPAAQEARPLAGLRDILVGTGARQESDKS